MDPGTPVGRCRIFISAKRSDRNVIGVKIQTQLSEMSAGRLEFFSAAPLKPGESSRDEIRKALGSADILLQVISQQDGDAFDGLLYEVEMFEDLHLSTPGRVVLLVREGVELPDALASFFVVRGRTREISRFLLLLFQRADLSATEAPLNVAVREADFRGLADQISEQLSRRNKPDVGRAPLDAGAPAQVHSVPRRSRPVRDQVFVSYSREDARWRDELKTTLAPLVRKGNLVLWDDSKIKPGARWKDEITTALASAKVAVLLVSRYFLASEFVVRNELPELLNAAEGQGVTILWLPVSASGYEETEIADYQALCDPNRPLDSLRPSELSKELVNVSRKISDAYKG